MMKRLLRFVAILTVSILLFGLGVVTGSGFDRFLLDAQTAGEARLDYVLLNQALGLVQRHYVDRSAIQSRALTYGAISGMVDALGDIGHSHFLTPEMVAEERNATQGELEGIGVEIQSKNGSTVIVAPIDGSPAQQAGLRPGEIILKVNGEDVTSLALGQIAQRILGPAGTQVTVTLFNPESGQTRQLTLTRARITLQNVTWQQIPGSQVAHLRIAAFSQGVTDDLKQALQAIQQQNLAGVILDLRSDPGGLLNEAIGVTSQFLAQGDVLQVQDAAGQIESVPVQPNGVATQIPLVVLVNPGTASAAEIVAGALQDAGRATLIGETTFGTGTVLQEFPLSDGSALLLATEEWLTPSGRVIWHKGIEPDTVVSLPAGATPLVPRTEQGMTAAEIQASNDQQVLQALEHLEEAQSQSGLKPISGAVALHRHVWSHGARPPAVRAESVFPTPR